MKISHWNTAADLTRGAPIRCNCAPCWIENRRHRRASSGHRKDTSHKQNQDPFTARQVFELVGILLCPRIVSWQVGLRGTQADEAAMPGPNATAQAHRVLELAGILSCVLIVSWQIGLLGTRVGEAAVPGPVVTAQAQSEIANPFVSETRGGGRARLREVHSDVPLCMLQRVESRSREQMHCQVNVDQEHLFTEGGGREHLKSAAVLDEELGETEFGHDRLSEGESEEALETDYDSDIQTMFNDENTIPRLYRSNREAKQKERSDFSLSPPDVRATGQGARFISRQTASHTPLGGKFLNMTAFSTQHPAIFELGCHVCGLQETRLTEAGQTWAR